MNEIDNAIKEIANDPQMLFHYPINAGYNVSVTAQVQYVLIRLRLFSIS